MGEVIEEFRMTGMMISSSLKNKRKGKMASRIWRIATEPTSHFLAMDINDVFLGDYSSYFGTA